MKDQQASMPVCLKSYIHINLAKMFLIHKGISLLWVYTGTNNCVVTDLVHSSGIPATFSPSLFAAAVADDQQV